MEDKTVYIDEAELAMLISVSVSTLRNNRFLKRGIPYVKIGKSVRYDSRDVELYMAQNKTITRCK